MARARVSRQVGPAYTSSEEEDALLGSQGDGLEPSCDGAAKVAGAAGVNEGEHLFGDAAAQGHFLDYRVGGFPGVGQAHEGAWKVGGAAPRHDHSGDGGSRLAR